MTRFLFAIALSLALFFMTSGAASKNQPAPKPIVLSTDTGGDPDDHWVLAHLALSPEFELRAAVISFVPGLKNSAELLAGLARETVALLPKSKRPKILAGSNKALGQQSPLKHELRGAQAILDSSKGFDQHNRLPVMMIGPATDVALALLLDRSLAKRIEIVAMGFEKWPEGDDPWNVRADVRAWQTILDMDVPVALFTASAAKKDLTICRSEVASYFSNLHPLADHLKIIFDEWLDEHPDHAVAETGRKDCWVSWDVGALAYLLGMSKYTDHARPELTEQLEFIPRDHRQGLPPLRIIHDVDSENLRAHFRRLLKSMK